MVDTGVSAVLALYSSEVSDKCWCRSAYRFIIRVDADPFICSDTVIRYQVSTRICTIELESILYESSSSIVGDIICADQSSYRSSDSPTSTWDPREERSIRKERWYESVGDSYEYQYTYEGREDFIHIGYELADFEMSDDSIISVIFPRDK